MITDKPICNICSDQTRDQTILMVVSDAKDVFQIEKMKTYQGIYHVLGGLIDFFAWYNRQRPSYRYPP